MVFVLFWVFFLSIAGNYQNPCDKLGNIFVMRAGDHELRFNMTRLIIKIRLTFKFPYNFLQDTLYKPYYLRPCYLMPYYFRHLSTPWLFETPLTIWDLQVRHYCLKHPLLFKYTFFDFNIIQYY